MGDFEKLGLFYLGRPVDSATGTTQPEPFLLDSRDLATHAVCVGMTGSGKTGLCLSMLEEAAIDGVPVIAIDPKGDVGNVMLSFPALDAASFAPWVSADEAARAGLTVEAFAEREATKWRDGLAGWGQDGARITRMREAAEFAVYTPGSKAGTPLSVLSSLAAPPPAVRDDDEVLGDRVSSLVAALLGLLGIDADPLTSRDHILLSTIVRDAWADGRDVALGALIQQIQQPAITRLGVMELESFYPQKERFVLATRLNNLLASPGFAAWLDGEPLDIGRLLYNAAGKPRVSIISISHLDDAERMFVVSLILGEIVAWMRMQSGTTSLRALIYMDEVFGFLPPVANPPSKRPLLTLFKQARAFGVGVCLATQNPVDLDYKALSNAGTWFIGRLQTDRDRARLLDGLEGAGGGTMDRAAAEAAITGLGKRRFLVHNVHRAAPVEIETRWCLSYLRGPLTREDLKRLARPLGQVLPPAPAATAVNQPSAPTHTASVARPLLAPEIPQFFDGAGSSSAIWMPTLYGAARVTFADAKRGVDESRLVAVTVPIDPSTVVIDWDTGAPTDLRPEDLLAEAPETGSFGPLPAQAQQARAFVKWARDFDRWAGRTQRLTLFRHPGLSVVSQVDEDERDFRIRLASLAREARDATVDKMRTKFASKLRTAAEKVRRAEMALGKEQQDVSQHRVQAGLSVASTIGSVMLGAIFGRRGGLTAGTIGKASTSAKGMMRGAKEAEDVKRAEQNLASAHEALATLEREMESAVAAVDSTSVVTDALETLTVAPKRGGINVQVVALVWTARVPA
ncbi:MAG: DUF87 domain-containing protein [Acidobacteria bacterium]|nr:DUF87 domain-containing protein [Acidobacteriota bacterium]